MSDITRQKNVAKALGVWGAGLGGLLALVWAMGLPEFLRSLMLGLPQGAIIALIAIGYSMVYGIIQLINFAHGEVFMLSAYMTLMVMWHGEKDFPRQIEGVPLFVPVVVSLLLVYTAFTSANTLGAATPALRKRAFRWPFAALTGLIFGFACYQAFLSDSAASALAACLAGLAGAGAMWAFLRSRTNAPDARTCFGAAIGAGGAIAFACHPVFSSTLFLSALAISLAITATIGLTLDSAAYKPLRTAPRLIPLITAIGMSIFFQSLARVVWGPNPSLFRGEDLPAIMRQPESVPDKELHKLPWREQLSRAGCVIFKLSEQPAVMLEFLTGEEARTAEKAALDVSGVASVSSIVEKDYGQVTVRMKPGEAGAEKAIEAVKAAGVEIDYQDAYTEAKYLRLLALDAAIVALCLAVFGALQFLLHWTRLGKAMRACSQDKTTARLVGVNVDHVVAMTFIIGSMLAALAAPLYVVKYMPIKPEMGLMVGVLAFASAVLGGIGDIKGAMFGGLIIGLVYNFVPSLETIDLWPVVTEHRVISPETAAWLKAHFLGGISRWRLGVAYGVMILVIVVKPAGLFGRESAHRA